MAIAIGGNQINKAYLGTTEIYKMYLGSELVFDNSVPPVLLTPIMTNFRVEDANKDRVYFDTPLGPVTGITIDGFVISGKTITGVDTTNNYFTVSSAFDYFDNNTIRLGENDSTGDVNATVHNFTLEYIENNIVEPVSTTDMYVAVGGSGDGTSEGNAANMAYALTNCSEGEIWWLKAGDYGTFSDDVTNDGTLENPIKFIGYINTIGDITSNYYDYGVTWDTSEMPSFSSSSGMVFRFNAASHVIFKNIQVTGSDHYCIGEAGTSDHIIFERCNTRFGAGGIGFVNDTDTSSLNNIRVVDCVSYEASTTNIILRGGGNCLVKDSKSYTDGSSGTSDYNITIGGDNNIVTNCTVKNYQQIGSIHGIGVRSAQMTSSKYNLIEKSSADNLQECFFVRNTNCDYNVIKNNTALATIIPFGDKDTGGLHIHGEGNYNIFENNMVKDQCYPVSFWDKDEDGDPSNSIGTGNIFRNNIIDQYYVGLYFAHIGSTNPYIDNTYIYNNVFKGQLSDGGFAHNDAAITINGFYLTNNIIDTCANGFIEFTGSEFTFTNNNFFNTGTWSNGYIGSDGNIDEDPQLNVSFVPQADFSLISKPRIDGIYYDMDGVTRANPTTLGPKLSPSEEAGEQPPTETTVYPTEISDPLINPGKGWIIYSELSNVDPEPLAMGTVGYYRYTWDLLEPTNGGYDFSYIEADIVRALNAGLKWTFGIVPTNDGKGTPQWLFDELGCAYTNYDDNGTIRKIPVWDDPIFIDEMTKIIQACAVLYNGHEDIAYIDNRFYGNWGEWHLGGLGGVEPSDAVLQSFVDIYNTAFDQTQIIQPNASQKEYARDTYNNGWRQDSAEYSGLWDSLAANSETAPAVAEISGGYELNKIGGSWHGEVWTDDMLIQSILQSKYTYYGLGAGNGTDANTFWADKQSLIEEQTNKLGYWFKIVSATYSDNLGNGSQGTISFDVRNDGVARKSIKGKTGVVKVALLDDSDNVLQTVILNGIDPIDWSPGNVITESSSFSFSSNVLGTKLAIGVFSEESLTDPDTKLGIENGVNNWYVLNEAYTPILGDELITEGDFSNGGAAWDFSSSAWSVVSEEAVCTADASFGNLFQFGLGDQIGKSFRVSFEYTQTGGIREGRFGVFGIEVENFSSSGIPDGLRTFDITASTDTLLYISSENSGNNYKIDNVSVKEIL